MTIGADLSRLQCEIHLPRLEVRRTLSLNRIEPLQMFDDRDTGKIGSVANGYLAGKHACGFSALHAMCAAARLANGPICNRVTAPAGT